MTDYIISGLGSLIVTYYTIYFVSWVGIKVLDKWIELDKTKKGIR